MYRNQRPVQHQPLVQPGLDPVYVQIRVKNNALHQLKTRSIRPFLRTRWSALRIASSAKTIFMASSSASVSLATPGV